MSELNNFIDWEKHIKRFTFYVSLLYVLGFLIINLRLSRFGVFVKDPFTLDYLKAGILFVFTTVIPTYVLYQLYDTDYKLWKKLLFSFVITIIWYSLILTLIMNLGKNKVWYYDTLYHYLPYLILTSGFAFMMLPHRFKNNKSVFDIIDWQTRILIFGVYLNFFSVSFYSQIEYEYGGGKLYKKTITLVSG